MNLEQQRAAAQTLCNELNVTVLPHGNAWWLLGDRINLVVGEIAGLSAAGLKQMRRPHYPRSHPGTASRTEHTRLTRRTPSAR